MLVAPFGGTERRFSTAPFCVGIPRPGLSPLILDFATSLVAEGKALVASRGGKKLPPDALIGPDGTVSGDPRGYASYVASVLATRWASLHRRLCLGRHSVLRILVRECGLKTSL